MSIAGPDEPTKGKTGTGESEPATDDVIVRRPFPVPNPTTYTTKGGRAVAADADDEGAKPSSET